MLSYQETVALLTLKLPMFSRIGQAAIKPGLDNIERLCAALNHPEQKFPSIHIAGTNGKGSTSHMIAGALQQAGYRTGLYTSPHLVDLRERIRINGVPISESFVIQFVEKIKPLLDTLSPSYFELNVAMAFAAFADAGVDVAVVETGLGGRLDSTNILLPVLSIITNIGLDHTQILGDTLPLIAKEKAGIIKEKVPVIVGETQPETEQVFFLAAHSRQTSIVYADSLWDMVRIKQDEAFQYYKAIHKGEQKMYDLKTDLLGSYQAHNIKTVLTSCDLLQQMGWRLNREGVLKSLEQVKATTGLRGRWERLGLRPEIVLDVAHNAEGMAFLAANLAALKESGAGTARLRIVCGFVSDKDVAKALTLFPRDAVYYFTQADVPRAMPFGELAGIAVRSQLEGTAYPSVSAALAAAREEAGDDDVILVTGSFFVVGEAISVLEQRAVS
ncbi:bifunctional folylpolyglutamate synthase/dihydrofolate synthase [Taibaiella koreensis]|uniref:bifunctional folylpolyglutamate synthase/dihydrofolate synthase n=1 Tax=Taibaiella koreensis TaxID=1268548 RepID=UPI000E5A0251|nr:folylpolyglutamate synthase/dihydrofolate synthase family protein [Taibaiella koreensis]